MTAEKIYIIGDVHGCLDMLKRLMDKISWAIVKPVMDYDSFEDALTWHESTTVDLSGGGALIRVSEELTADDRVLIRLALFQGLGLPETVAAVCRRAAVREQQRLAGLEFILSDYLRKHFDSRELEQLPASVGLFDRAAQNKLVNFIFQQQVELRQKGLL